MGWSVPADRSSALVGDRKQVGVRIRLQVARPEWSSTFDTTPQLSAQSRRNLLGHLAEEEILVLGTAFPDPSAGRVHRRSDGFLFTPEPSL
jgi:hypothetical protein